MSDRKVLVENMSNATVTLIFSNSNFKRKLKGEGAKTHIPFDVIYEGLSEPGVMIMFDKGIIRVVDKQDRVDLGLEMEEEVVATSLSSSEMLAILKENNPIKIKETLEGLAENQQKKFAQVAIENDIYSAGLAKFIKDYTGIDLLKAMQDYKAEKEDATETR